MRLRILHTLWDREMTVGEIIAETGGLQANVSKHLGILQQASLVSRRKEGLNVYYQICDESVYELCELVCAGLYDRLAAQMSELPPPAAQPRRGS
jgi:ArsR family transcriptional regulator